MRKIPPVPMKDLWNYNPCGPRNRWGKRTCGHCGYGWRHKKWCPHRRRMLRVPPFGFRR